MNDKAESLWCMHVIGPDDLHAAPSKKSAQQACDLYSKQFAERAEKYGVLLRFEVAQWPHSRESHAEDLRRWETEIMPPPPNTGIKPRRRRRLE